MTPELLAIINGSCILILRVTSTLAADLLQLAETRPGVLIAFGVGCIRVGDGALCLSTEHARYVQTLGDLDFTKYAQGAASTLMQAVVQAVGVAGVAATDALTAAGKVSKGQKL